MCKEYTVLPYHSWFPPHRLGITELRGLLLLLPKDPCKWSSWILAADIRWALCHNCWEISMKWIIHLKFLCTLSFSPAFVRPAGHLLKPLHAAAVIAHSSVEYLNTLPVQKLFISIFTYTNSFNEPVIGMAVWICCSSFILSILPEAGQ